MVNQVETHVFNQQLEARKYMDEIGTRIMSWGPLAEGKNNFFPQSHLPESVRNIINRWLR